MQHADQSFHVSHMQAYRGLVQNVAHALQIEEPSWVVMRMGCQYF